MEGQDSIYLGLYEENYKNVCLHAHFPMYTGFGAKAAYTHEYSFKSHVYVQTGVFQDNTGISKYNM